MSELSFLEFSLELDAKYLDAFKLYSKVKTGQEEKTKQEWKELFNNFLNKTIN